MCVCEHRAMEEGGCQDPSRLTETSTETGDEEWLVHSPQLPRGGGSGRWLESSLPAGCGQEQGSPPSECSPLSEGATLPAMKAAQAPSPSGPVEAAAAPLTAVASQAGASPATSRRTTSLLISSWSGAKTQAHGPGCCFGWLRAVPGIERSPVRFPARAHTLPSPCSNKSIKTY